MNKKQILMYILVLLLICNLSAGALSLSDFDKELLLRVFADVDSGEIDYMARLGLDSEEIGLLFYYYGNAGKKLDEREIDDIIRNRENLEDFNMYFGLPPIIFDDEEVKFRHPKRERHFPPLGDKKYDKRYNFKHGFEKVEVRGNNYNYQYQNKKLGIEEKIEIKNQKYEYFYRDTNMEEKLEVKYPSNKYNYYYKNFNTGKTIKKEGWGEPLTRDKLYRKLKERAREEETGFKLNVKINLNKLLDE